MEKTGMIGLIGFSGVGKTAIAEIASEEGILVCDTDRYIVEREGMEIPQIFEKLGEEGFRDIESDSIETLLDAGFELVSFGGGVHYSHSSYMVISESPIYLIYIHHRSSLPSNLCHLLMLGLLCLVF